MLIMSRETDLTSVNRRLLYFGAGIDLVATVTSTWKGLCEGNVVFNVTLQVCVCIRR